jgi:hypothetical protein
LTDSLNFTGFMLLPLIREQLKQQERRMAFVHVVDCGVWVAERSNHSRSANAQDKLLKHPHVLVATIQGVCDVPIGLSILADICV